MRDIEDLPADAGSLLSEADGNLRIKDFRRNPFPAIRSEGKDSMGKPLQIIGGAAGNPDAQA
jgi:hypothetical protein